MMSEVVADKVHSPTMVASAHWTLTMNHELFPAKGFRFTPTMTIVCVCVWKLSVLDKQI